MQLAMVIRGGLVLICVACSQRPSRPGTSRSGIAGSWNAEFVVDSFILARRPVRTAPATGVVTFGDSTRLAGARGEWGIATTMRVDFRPALGRQLSCLDQDGSVTAVSAHGDSLHLNFTPQAADCGLHAVGRARGDTISGRWVEPGYAIQALGHFTLVRRS